MFRMTEDPSSGSLVQSVLQAAYAAITPTTSMSTDTIEPFL